MFKSLKTIRVAAALVAAFAGTAACVHAQLSIAFHLVGALPGSNTFSSGYGVSEDGSVVVGHSGNNYYYGSSSHAFRWTSESGIQDLDPLAPAAGAYGISSDGTVIVGGETSGSVKAVRWGASTSSVTDQLYHGGECYALSHDGNMAIGWSASGGAGGGGGAFRPHRAIRYSNNGGHLEYVDTPALNSVAATNSEALATNTDGSVVAGWAVIGGVQRAFVWNSTDNMTPITPGAGIANGVSGDGSVVVGDYQVGSTRHAFRWTAAGGLVDLGTLPGNVRSVAFAISTDGSTIVGMSATTAAGANQHAFVWRSDTGMQDLNSVLVAKTPAGYTLTEARAVNSTGTVIAGGSKTPGGGVEAWVATGVSLPGCGADFNGSGSLEVQDVFDYLNAWFAGDIRADFNRVNGLEVQDIFDYLSAWFAGC
jgi:probable HAF family extracellular repeat protein